MGFDLTGTIHKTIPEPNWELEWDHADIKQYFATRDKTRGAYFHANCWAWRPIPVLVRKLGFLKTEAELNGWAYNDCYEVDKGEAKEIAFAILDWLDCMVQEKDIPEGEEAHYLVNMEGNVMGEMEFCEVWRKLPENMEDCDICEGTGKRNDKLGQDARKADPEYACNGCSGKGTKPKWDCEYAISLDHLEQFAEFARASGGFRIG